MRNKNQYNLTEERAVKGYVKRSLGSTILYPSVRDEALFYGAFQDPGVPS